MIWNEISERKEKWKEIIIRIIMKEKMGGKNFCTHLRWYTFNFTFLSNYPHAYLGILFSNWVNFSRRTFYLYTRRVLFSPTSHIHISTHIPDVVLESNRYLYRCTMMEADGGILFLSQWLITPRWRRIRDSRN